MVLKFMVLSVIIFITVYLVLLLKSPMPFQLISAWSYTDAQKIADWFSKFCTAGNISHILLVDLTILKLWLCKHFYLMVMMVYLSHWHLEIWFKNGPDYTYLYHYHRWISIGLVTLCEEITLAMFLDIFSQTMFVKLAPIPLRSLSICRFS